MYTRASLEQFEWWWGATHILLTDCHGKLNDCNVFPSPVLFASGCKNNQGSPQNFSEVYDILSSLIEFLRSHGVEFRARLRAPKKNNQTLNAVWCILEHFLSFSLALSPRGKK